VDSIYSLLWKENERGERFRSCKVPDTVLFFETVPPQWYFTSSKDSQTLLRKNRWSITNENMFSEFVKSVEHEDDVVAMFVHDDEVEDEEQELRPGKPKNVQINTILEYFKQRDLYNFLFEGHRKKSGILQRFVSPKGPSNFVIQATWTPQMCLIEKRVNRNRLLDRRRELYSRVVTYEGAEHLSYYGMAPTHAQIGGNGNSILVFLFLIFDFTLHLFSPNHIFSSCCIHPQCVFKHG
jgi:hypothetical protein